MRISDWSSDVCSSDLILRRSAHLSGESGRWGRRIAAVLSPLLLTACGAAPSGPEARPAMWLVADDDTKIYILGTMHALPRGTDWDAGRVASATKAADELRMELAPAELAAAGEMFRKLAPRDAPLEIERSEEHTT